VSFVVINSGSNGISTMAADGGKKAKGKGMNGNVSSSNSIMTANGGTQQLSPVICTSNSTANDNSGNLLPKRNGKIQNIMWEDVDDYEPQGVDEEYLKINNIVERNNSNIQETILLSATSVNNVGTSSNERRLMNPPYNNVGRQRTLFGGSRTSLPENDSNLNLALAERYHPVWQDSPLHNISATTSSTSGHSNVSANSARSAKNSSRRHPMTQTYYANDNNMELHHQNQHQQSSNNRVTILSEVFSTEDSLDASYNDANVVGDQHEDDDDGVNEDNAILDDSKTRSNVNVEIATQFPQHIIQGFHNPLLIHPVGSVAYWAYSFIKRNDIAAYLDGLRNQGISPLDHFEDIIEQLTTLSEFLELTTTMRDSVVSKIMKILKNRKKNRESNQRKRMGVTDFYKSVFGRKRSIDGRFV